MNPRAALLACLLAVIPHASFAALKVSDIQEPVLVTRVECTIVIDKLGNVARYESHTPLPEPIADRVRDMVQAVRFVPVEDQGRVVDAQVDMRVVVTASPLADGGMRLSVENLVFPDDMKAEPNASVPGARTGRRVIPTYPLAALRAHAEADQIAVLRFDAQGNVADAAIEQSALVHGRGNPAQVARVLDLFERSALAALRQWKLDPSMIPDDARRAGSYVAYVPVRWRAAPAGTPSEAKPGEWTLETRTRRQVPAWRRQEPLAPQPGAADLANGEMRGINTRFRLAVPLGTDAPPAS